MAKLLDEDIIEEEQLKEEDEDDTGEREKKVFINNLDSFQGKCIARVSINSWDRLRNQLIDVQFFARVKPGATTQSAEEEDKDKDKEGSHQKLMDIEDDQPKENGWKVSGTVQNQSYTKPAYIQEIVQVEVRYSLNLN